MRGKGNPATGVVRVAEATFRMYDLWPENPSVRLVSRFGGRLRMQLHLIVTIPFHGLESGLDELDIAIKKLFSKENQGAVVEFENLFRPLS